MDITISHPIIEVGKHGSLPELREWMPNYRRNIIDEKTLLPIGFIALLILVTWRISAICFQGELLTTRLSETENRQAKILERVVTLETRR